ncbi:MAG: hypothetical protein WAP57_11890 [Aquabacterium commune]|jgi:hypothetical protein|uniref:hypothetical protein n=1 Tax=Aquabacterium commune TaxID=70586 RepID=UPI003BAF3FD1
MKLYVRIDGVTAVFESENVNHSMAQVEVALELARCGVPEWGVILAVIDGGKQ